MSVKRSMVAVFGCSLLLGCGGGGASAPPQPVGTESPAPNPQEPQPDPQNPAPDSQSPEIGGEEPLPNAQDPLPSGSAQIGAQGGASPGDP
ncbi:MAG: hypothetical protein WDO74_33410 [Pseudomonadota bacterium]